MARVRPEAQAGGNRPEVHPWVVFLRYALAFTCAATVTVNVVRLEMGGFTTLSKGFGLLAVLAALSCTLLYPQAARRVASNLIPMLIYFAAYQVSCVLLGWQSIALPPDRQVNFLLLTFTAGLWISVDQDFRPLTVLVALAVAWAAWRAYLDWQQESAIAIEGQIVRTVGVLGNANTGTLSAVAGLPWLMHGMVRGQHTALRFAAAIGVLGCVTIAYTSVSRAGALGMAGALAAVALSTRPSRALRAASLVGVPLGATGVWWIFQQRKEWGSSGRDTLFDAVWRALGEAPLGIGSERFLQFTGGMGEHGNIALTLVTMGVPGALLYGLMIGYPALLLWHSWRDPRSRYDSRTSIALSCFAAIALYQELNPVIHQTWWWVSYGWIIGGTQSALAQAQPRTRQGSDRTARGAYMDRRI